MAGQGRVQGRYLGPVGGARLGRGGVARGYRGLQLVGAGPPEPRGPGEYPRALVDLGAVPGATVLVLEQHEAVPSPGVAQGVGEQ